MSEPIWDKTSPLSFCATPEQRAWVDAECKRLGLKRSTFLRSILVDAMQHDEPKAAEP